MEKDIIGAIVLVALLIVQQYFNRKKGIKNATVYEQESAKLVRQTSEVVNRCAAENKIILVALNRHLEKNDLGHLSTELNNAIRMLEAMVERQNIGIVTLDRISSLVHSISDDIQKTDSRIVHERISNNLHTVEMLVEDIKRIVTK